MDSGFAALLQVQTVHAAVVCIVPAVVKAMHLVGRLPHLKHTFILLQNMMEQYPPLSIISHSSIYLDCSTVSVPFSRYNPL